MQSAKIPACVCHRSGASQHQSGNVEQHQPDICLHQATQSTNCITWRISCICQGVQGSEVTQLAKVHIARLHEGIKAQHSPAAACSGNFCHGVSGFDAGQSDVSRALTAANLAPVVPRRDLKTNTGCDRGVCVTSHLADTATRQLTSMLTSETHR